MEAARSTPTPARPEPKIQPAAVVDLILALLVHEKAIAAFIEPAADGHVLKFETIVGDSRTVALPGDLGDAVIVRMALLTGFELGNTPTHLGRKRVRHGARVHEILAMMSGGPGGLSLELRRIVTASESGSLPVATSSGNRLGPYRLFEEIGRGGTGGVFRAEHVALQRPVAIKILSPVVTNDSQRGALLLREGRAASRVQHESIVDVTDFGSTPDGQVFLVMELVTWPTLEKRLEQGPLSPQRTITIARGILRALGATHTRGIIHRDLKPSNVFVSDEDEVKVGDFGAATVVAGNTPLSSASEKIPVWGTAQYMAPEHSRGEADRRSDLYALGVMLFEMLTGKVPFDGKTLIDVMVQHIEANIPAMNNRQGPVPQVMVDIVHRAMTKNPSDRYQRVSDMIMDLEKAALSLTRRGWQKWLPP